MERMYVVTALHDKDEKQVVTCIYGSVKFENALKVARSAADYGYVFNTPGTFISVTNLPPDVPIHIKGHAVILVRTRTKEGWKEDWYDTAYKKQVEKQESVEKGCGIWG